MKGNIFCVWNIPRKGMCNQHILFEVEASHCKLNHSVAFRRTCYLLAGILFSCHHIWFRFAIVIKGSARNLSKERRLTNPLCTDRALISMKGWQQRVFSPKYNTHCTPCNSWHSVTRYRESFNEVQWFLTRQSITTQPLEIKTITLQWLTESCIILIQFSETLL